jgi:hypothetical protein
MPSRVRIISPRNSAEWDDLVRDVLNRGALGVEHDYFGITTEERADKVRRCIGTAGRHLGAGRKVYWKPCPAPGACANGGPECKYHVYYTVYDLDVARAYKVKQAESNGQHPE